MLDRLHEGYVHGRRNRRLSEHLSELIPPGCNLLDVGCGDGQLARSLQQKRPDLRIEGVEIQLRKQTWIPVTQFDGKCLPYGESRFDGVMLIDVLHHTPDPRRLLREALRVSRRWLILKDHILRGPWAGMRLRFMDYVGNARHAVALPYNYLSAEEWNELRRALDLQIAVEVKQLGLYPWPFDFIFGAKLQFLALLERAVPPQPTRA
ncbi:MAG TPA: class I SAM-dependent methyltransferase [Terriglobales bacterium]|nr:class I SAM-dependent methyltransferase [Terriglobales bacterium]